MENVTQSLADFAGGLKFDHLERDLVTKFKKYLLDGIGCDVHGTSQPWGRIINRFVIGQGGKEEATLWLQKFQGPSANVALGLGVMIHSFDFDDYHNAKVHPGAAVIPAALAVEEATGAAGRGVLPAIVEKILVKTAKSVIVQCGYGMFPEPFMQRADDVRRSIESPVPGA